MNRPIVLPSVHAYARASVEEDRASITVTDADVAEAIQAHDRLGPNRYRSEYFRAALESYAARLRGGA
jgi:hypothetical protein